MALCDPSTPFSSTPQEIQWYKSVNLIQREYPFGSHVRCVTPPRVSPGTYVQSCCSQLLVNCLAISVQLWRYERAHVYPPPPHAPAGPPPHTRARTCRRPWDRGRTPCGASTRASPATGHVTNRPRRADFVLPFSPPPRALRGSPVPRLDSPARGLNYGKNRNEIG